MECTGEAKIIKGEKLLLTDSPQYQDYLLFLQLNRNDGNII